MQQSAQINGAPSISPTVCKDPVLLCPPPAQTFSYSVSELGRKHGLWRPGTPNLCWAPSI